jgi:2-haloacid dehalogenase
VVSGVEGIVKPDPEIYRLACRRLGIEPSRAVFVDDTLANAVAASGVGLVGLQFTGAAALRADLVRLGLLGEPEPVPGPIYHWALREDWERAAVSVYPWSTRGVDYERAGFVHCSLPGQVDGIRAAIFGDLPREDLVLLELDPAGLPVVLEDGGTGEEYPHLFAPLPVGLARPVDAPAQASL